MDLEKRKVAVLGLALSGEAAVLALLKRGAEVIAIDRLPALELEGRAERLSRTGVRLHLGDDNDASVLNGVELLVISPGIPDAHPLCLAARERGIEIVGEVELGYRLRPDLRYLAVTGSNGKTTCTSILAAALAAGGHPGIALGNVGTPLCSYLEELPPEAPVAIEMSSYQLRDSREFHAHVGVLLNITPDHLDVHGSLQEYARCKGLVFRGQTSHDFAVYFIDDHSVAWMVRDVPARHLPFSLTRELNEGGCICRGSLLLRFAGQEAELGRKGDFLLQGSHNHANLLAAGLAAWSAGVSPQDFIPILCAFRPLPHRLEPCGKLGGVTFINDSKATNVDSVIMALRSQDKPVVLIAGNKDKDSDFDALIPLLRLKVKAAVLIGSAAEKIQLAWQGIIPLHIIPFVPQPQMPVPGMGRAVRLAWELAKPDGIVLLSPACASFDMYRNYEQRGDVFKAEVARLIAEVSAG